MSELRHDPIAGRWIIIATERARRPSDFELEEEVSTGGDCPFCVGNEEKTPPEVLAYRERGSLPNRPGWWIRVVSNKYPALKREGETELERVGRYERMDGVGAHEVIIESPQHKSSFYTLSRDHVTDILKVFRERIIALSGDSRLCYVVVFKNRGRVAGASLEHDHSQLIALPIVPLVVQAEMDGAKMYYNYKDRCVFCDIIYQEKTTGARLISENDDFVILCPYAPRFPFETWILPKHHATMLEDCRKGEYANLAQALKDTITRMDKVLQDPPYNFIIHNSPLHDYHDVPYYHWHIEIIPKLTKVAGFEWGTGFYINPTPPEDAATFLREIEL